MISQKVSWKEKLSSSRMHCFYIILSTEFKLSCLLCSWLKEKKKMFYVTKTKECREKKDVCPFRLLENSRPLPPLQEPQTPFSSLGTLDFLSTCLGIDSFINYKLGALLTSPWLMLANGVNGLLCCVTEKLVSMCYELCPPTKVLMMKF